MAERGDHDFRARDGLRFTLCPGPGAANVYARRSGRLPKRAGLVQSD